jgi:hypothetical protein
MRPRQDRLNFGGPRGGVVGVEFRDGLVDQFSGIGGVQDIGEPDVDSDNGVVWDRGEACAAVYFGDGEFGR